MSGEVEVYQLKGMAQPKRRAWKKTGGYSLRGRPRKKCEFKEEDRSH